MKKSLLLLASLVVSAASYADWTKPVPAAVASYQYSTFAEEGGDTIVYYLYNKEAKAFFTEGNAWGTQASFADQGLKVAITKYIPEDGEWDGKTVFINDYSLKKSAWKKLFIDSETQSFVDLGTQTNFYWEIPSIGDGLYNIRGAEMNPTYNVGYLFGVDGNAIESGATTLAPYIDPAEDTQAQCTWQFITPEAYDAYQAALPTYLMAVKLGNAIETAKEYDINTAAQQKVYDNTQSTLEELTAAYETVNDAIKKAEFGDATEDNPKECTSWLVNPDFSAGNITGWDCTFVAGKNATNIGYQSASYGNGDVSISAFIEAWTPNALNENIPGVNAIGVGQLSQTIKNMPQGKYKLTVDCIAVAQNVAENNPVKGVQLFATGGDLDVYQALATGNGKPEHFELVFVNNGDDITMGLRTTAECVANWIAADNFTLTYYGPTKEDPEKINMDQVVEKALAVYSLEDVEAEDFYAAKADKDAYIKAVEDAQSASSNYTDYGTAVTEALATLKTSVSAYSAYVKEVERVRTYLSEHELAPCDQVDLVADYADEGNDVGPGTYENGTSAYILANQQLNAEEITAETTKLGEMLKAAIVAGIYEGMDCTDMLVNPDFSSTTGAGWTKAKGSPVMHGGLEGFPCAELWHATFDIYQDVAGVPDGIYALSLNGFCRFDNGQTEVPAFIYMNDFASPLMDIDGDLLPADQAEDGINCYLTNGATSQALTNEASKFFGNPVNTTNDFVDTTMDDGSYRPNSMQGASVAFSAGRYKATVYGLVEGGKIRVGVRNLTDNQVWALWSNFRLTYMGKNQEALSSILPTYVERLSTYAENNAEFLTDPETAAISKAIENGEKASTADEMYDALIAINSEITNAQENVAAATNFDNAVIDLSNALETYPNADQKYYEAIAPKLDNIKSLTTAEINKLISDINDVITRMAIPDGTGASDESPIDFTSVIKNYDFEANAAGEQATGWTLVKGATASGNYQTQTGFDGGVSMEFWSPTQGEGTQFDFYQVVKFLPAGTYELTVEASNSLNGQEAGEGTGNAYIYVDAAGRESLSDPIVIQTEGCKDARNTYSIIFTINADEEVKIGAKNVDQLSARWVMIDNFNLKYYGTNSSYADPTAIATVNSAISASEIYSATGARTNKLQKGINIVKMSNGTVQKVLVK